MCYKTTQLNITIQTRDTTHIHQRKHRWPTHARPSICSELSSCWDWSSSLMVNLYAIIPAPLLTRHLVLWVAKCLCARTSRPLLLLVLYPHAWAKNIKGQMGEKNSCLWASPLQSLVPMECVRSVFFQHTRTHSESLKVCQEVCGNNHFMSAQLWREH